MSVGEFSSSGKRSAQYRDRSNNTEDLHFRLNSAKRRRMDDDLDPGPAFAPRNPRGRGRGNQRGRGGWRNQPDDDWRNNRHVQRDGSNSRNNFGRHFPARDNRGNADMEQHHGNDNARRPYNNQRRGNTHINLNNMRLVQNTDGNHRRPNHGHDNNRKKYIGFKLLEEISQSDSQDALAKLTERKEAFMELIQSPIEKLDMFALIIECMAKVCQSSFDELKLNLVRDTCNSNFIVSLKGYMVDLPYPPSKPANNMYWKDPDTFWKNLLIFFESVINTSPTLALDKCRSLVEATANACLSGLKERHSYNLPDEYVTKFNDLRDTMNNFERKKEADQKAGKRCRLQDAETPPENFRELSIMPTREDLLQKRPFLRPNIVDGSYQNVEHYLDVQFRLLREDCFGPLRDGLGQYIEDPKRKKYDNIRVFHNVKFAKPYVSQTKIGSFVQIDLNANRNFRRINWNNSKRFIFGSLVLFTKNNCKSFLVGTILDREEKFLREGLIPVSLMGGEFNERLYNDDEPFTMIESEVYFEPYLHVLRALQDPTFPDHIAMKQYIIHVNPEPKPPSYLQLDSQFKVSLTEKQQKPVIDDDDDEESDESDSETELLNSLLDEKTDHSAKCQFTVLEDATWPDKDTLKFNESQLEAYKLSLTHEFAVIQGPPGTGKTYLGIKVAQTLFENLKKNTKGCLMLVICYTNHALDQFLEALLKVTPSIARIGGQSKNEAMDPINLAKLRRNISIHSNAHSVFVDQKLQLKEVVSEFQKVMVELDVLLYGVMTSMMLQDIPEIKLLEQYYDKRQEKDPLYQWLFEDSAEYYGDVEALLLQENDAHIFVDPEKEARKRTGFQLDDQEHNEAEQMAHRGRISSFSLEEINMRMKDMISKYHECPDLVQKRNFVLQIQYLNSLKELYNDMAQHRTRRIDVRINERTNLRRFGRIDRWTLYFMWIHGKVTEKKTEIGVLQGRVTAASTAYEEARMLLDMQVLKDRRIVGMTTSGAARMRKLLQTLAPPIVIVEEAAEVLEQHIITSLTKDCSHLILIGDHQQLRPSASHMRLAKHYQIEVSLFERMITNGIHSRRLGVQHRMRPEIASLICPHIYPELVNHPTVYDFPDVKGMTKNLFFLTHDFKEEDIIDNQSRSNQKEADLVLALANYLMQQGYTPEEVTILAAYKGQMFYMRKSSDNYIHLKGIKITVVDNYQGEESKIILLSLVRNNDDNKIGFLGTANRICVALSRAKEGFYIFGNIENLKANSELWRNIAGTLEKEEALGTTITLKCQNHVNNLTEITKVEDFEHVPEGGCKAPCESYLRSCGHKCLLFCHGYDRDHSTNLTRCPRKCERVLCDLGHVCPKKCADTCGPCKRRVTKTLPCGHEMDIYCHLEPNDPTVQCHTMVEVTLPDCGHKANKMCFVNIKTVMCMIQCDYRVEKCGHVCMRKCHVKDDPDHEKYLCKKKCARAMAGCTAELQGDRGAHQCINYCYETCEDCTVEVVKRRSTCPHKERVACNKNIDEIPCKKNCAKKLPCEHFCKKLCWEACGDCREMVKKEIPECKHEIRIMCMLTPTRSLCRQKCERLMRCGHKCTGICGEECDPAFCEEPSGRQVASPCGHRVTLPCKMAALSADAIEESVLLSFCTAPCGEELACKHICGGSCARCYQGRVHAPCTQKCNQLNICEHQCEEPCNQICPPCKKQCEVRCQHSRCKQQCGAPCTSCKERCERRCKHLGACPRRCGEPCTRPPCDEPCARTLPCDHPCRGLCGEPCPPVCKLCDAENFPRDFLGDEYEDDAKFVLLQDCGHVMEVESMDSMILGDSKAIEVRKCPFCRKPIINTGRYKDFVNKLFKEGINPVKTKIFGTIKEIEQMKIELQAKVQQFREKYTAVLTAETNIKGVYLNTQAIVKSRKRVSKLQLVMVGVCLDAMTLIATSWQQLANAATSELRHELSAQMRLVCSVFAFRAQPGAVLKISEQQQHDLRLEIQRLDALVQLARLTSHDAYIAARQATAVCEEYARARRVILTSERFHQEPALRQLQKLQDAMKVAGVVTKQERDMVVSAMQMKAGTWFKCAKGHYYCIADCGGARTEGRCPECGDRIGGTNYTLAAGNRHAGEIDGSTETNIKGVYLNMQAIVKSRKRVSKLQLVMVGVCLDAMTLIATSWQQLANAATSELRHELSAQMRLVCSVFAFRAQPGAVLKISEQQQHDLRLEIQRLDALVQLARLTSHDAYIAARQVPAVRDEYARSRRLVLSSTRFQQEPALQQLRKLQDAMKVAGVVTKQERDMIVRAMQMKAGAWYKCPNGHYYCIGECGGAMEESNCPDCGAKIGGQDHALTAGNRHAGEIDGSRFSAWSNEYNNMANFDLNVV